jgi:hypothetical protein
MEGEMNRQDALWKIDEMVNSQDGVIEYIKKECERLLSCGAVDYDDYENNYVLPKLILTVALENCARQYLPPYNTQHKREVANLRKF